MKTTFLLISILLLTSCGEQATDLDVIISECYDAKYQEQGFDIRSIIDEYEKLLVAEDVLIDGTGKSYLEVLEKIASDQDYKITSPAFQEFDPWNKVDRGIAVGVFECDRNMIQVEKEKDSKWNKLIAKLESPEIKENPELIYRAYTETLSEEDLNSYYFKLKMFHLFDMANAKWENKS